MPKSYTKNSKKYTKNKSKSNRKKSKTIRTQRKPKIKSRKSFNKKQIKSKSKSEDGIYTVVLDLFYKQTTDKEIFIKESAIINYMKQFTADQAIQSNFGYSATCIVYIPNTAKWVGPMKISFKVKLNNKIDKYCEEDIKNKGVKGMIIDTFLHDSLEDSVYEGMPGESMWVVPWDLKRSDIRITKEELGLIDYRKMDNINIY
jgi:hypothetical protein